MVGRRIDSVEDLVSKTESEMSLEAVVYLLLERMP